MHHKIFFSRIPVHRQKVSDRGAMGLFHDRTAYTAASTGTHFNKAVGQRSIHNLFQRMDTVFCAVNGQTAVTVVFCPVHGAQDTARSREQTGTAFLVFLLFRLGCYLLAVHPLSQFLKGQHTVNDAGIGLRFRLFGNTRANKYRFGPGVLFFDQAAVGQHGRFNLGKIRQCLGIVFLNQQIDRMTAGGNDHFLFSLFYQALIFPLDQRCPDRSLLYCGKAQLLQSFFHRADSHAGIIGHKGRGQTYIHRRTGRNQRPGSFGVVSDFFGVLRAVDKALAAQNTLIVDNIGLVIGKFNRLDRTMPDTFIAVFTVGFF